MENPNSKYRVAPTADDSYRLEICRLRKRRGMPHVCIFRTNQMVGVWQGSDEARGAALVAELNAAPVAGRMACEDALFAETAKNLGR